MTQNRNSCNVSLGQMLLEFHKVESRKESFREHTCKLVYNLSAEILFGRYGDVLQSLSFSSPIGQLGRFGETIAQVPSPSVRRA